jgi:hypothetical protein
MALFSKAELKSRAQASSRTMTKSAKTILLEDSLSFSEAKKYDIFLSHSSMDAEMIYALREEINEMGFTVYIDWLEDPNLDRTNVNRKTADTLRKRMNNCRSLFYAVSINSFGSKWMPWELGYFDGIKNKVALLPIVEQQTTTNEFKGQEYLSLYPYITKDYPKGGSNKTLWVRKDEVNYILFSSWLTNNVQFTI